MKSISKNIPALLLAIFEIVAGIMLFRDPKGFTATVLLLFGLLLALVGIVYLVRFISSRNSGEPENLALLPATVAIAVGLFCIFGREFIIDLFSMLAVIYGILLIISGLYKLGSWNELRKLGVKGSPIALIACIASVICGVIVIVLPSESAEFALKFSAVVLIVEAAFDVISVLLGTIDNAKR